MRKMATSPSLLLFLFPAFSSSFIFALSEASTTSENDCFQKLQELKLRIRHLEFKPDETIRNLNEKELHIEEQEKLIQQMSHVQLLWAASRKNNFGIHVSACKAQDAEDRLKLVASQAEKMADIVTEHWIQIQRLEHALHITQMRPFKAQRKVMYSRCSFLKFIDRLFGDHPQKLQHRIKRQMEKNEFTAPLANWELASALITFPLIRAWVLLYSQLR